MPQLLSICGLAFEAISGLVYLCHGATSISATHTLVGAAMSSLPAAYYVSGKVFERMFHDRAADLAMQEAWNMSQRR